jgi:TRAP transporter 4TM/12TM fusion protein
MAEFLQITYAEVIVAALIPAILFYVALFVQADLEAARSGIDAVPKELIPAAGPVLRQGWFFPLPFVVLIAALFWLNYLPETAALLAALVVVVAAMTFGYRGKRFGPLDLLDALRSTGTGVLDIVMIGAAAGMVIGCISISGLGFALTQALVLIASGNLILLLVMSAVVCIILGMGMPTVGVYVLLATLVAPALVEVGIEPIAAHLFILYFGMMSMITPPVAIGAYAAATLTGADPLRTGFAAVRFGWLAFVIPFLFVASPTLLMQGSAVVIAADFVTATIGVWFGCIAIMGYFLRPVRVPARLAFGAAGLALLLPIGALGIGAWTNGAGVIVGALLVAWEVAARRRTGPLTRSKT